MANNFIDNPQRSQLSRLVRHRPGSALIITILIISALSSVAFSVSVLTISEFRKATALQDSIQAYYAAESGIEHGLMQYRIWHNAEIGQKFYERVQASQDPYQFNPDDPCDSPIPQETCTDSLGQTFRLTGDGDLAKAGFVASNSPDSDKGNAWYDLKMSFRANYLGAIPDDEGTPTIDTQSPKILRDSALQLAVPNGATRLVLNWKTFNEGKDQFQGNTDYKYFIEVAVIGTDATGQVKTVSALFPNKSIGPGSVNLRIPNNKVPIIFSRVSHVRIKPWGMEALQYGLRFCSGADPLATTCSVQESLIADKQTTTINSIGQYGNSKRQLQILVNRASGTILESEDFLVVSGTDLFNINR